MKRKIFDAAETAKVITEYQSGLSLRAIAVIHYVSEPTILNYLRNAGIARRDRIERWLKR